MKLSRNKKRVAVIGASVATVAVTATAAFAFWTAGGSATASGSTGSTQVLTARDGAISPALFPGDCSDVTFTLHNPNEKASPGIRAITKVDFGAATSEAAAYLRTPYLAAEGPTSNTVLVANGYDMQPIPAGGDRIVTLPNAICLAPSAPDSVQNTGVTINPTLSFKLEVGTEYTGS